ncbi:MAG: winged helix-turn-helix transcriptional regulator [Candidatus Aureabacteria bacterium]|nr:winged helix-turn-helix transcriptional regulator [Candidatus Auribacterota bacterium]
MELFKSNLRRKLLIYFFTHHDAELYLREIASKINVDAGNLSKELKGLEEEGIFNVRTRGNQKHFSLNQKYYLFEELKSIIFKKIGIKKR